MQTFTFAKIKLLEQINLWSRNYELFMHSVLHYAVVDREI